MDAESLRQIKQLIRNEVNIILSGATGDNSQVIKEDIESLYPGMATITERPVMHPYGFVSRAKPGVIQVVGRQGDHIGNVLVLGHRDSERPTEIESGEAVLYGPEGQVVFMKTGGLVQIGSSVSSPLAEFDTEEGLVGLGEDPTHPVGLADVILARIEAIEDKLNSFINSESGHTHVITTAPGTSGPGPIVTPLTPDTTDLGSTKVQVAT